MSDPRRPIRARRPIDRPLSCCLLHTKPSLPLLVIRSINFPTTTDSFAAAHPLSLHSQYTRRAACCTRLIPNLYLTSPGRSSIDRRCFPLIHPIHAKRNQNNMHKTLPQNRQQQKSRLHQPLPKAHQGRHRLLVPLARGIRRPLLALDRRHFLLILLLLLSRF